MRRTTTTTALSSRVFLHRLGAFLDHHERFVEGAAILIYSDSPDPTLTTRRWRMPEVVGAVHVVGVHAP